MNLSKKDIIRHTCLEMMSEDYTIEEMYLIKSKTTDDIGYCVVDQYAEEIDNHCDQCKIEEPLYFRFRECEEIPFHYLVMCVGKTKIDKINNGEIELKYTELLEKIDNPSEFTIPFWTTPEQKRAIKNHKSKMIEYGLDKDIVNAAAKLASFDQGIYDLMEMWVNFDSENDRKEVLIDIVKVVSDYSK